MDEKSQDRHYPSLVWPVILITVGVVFLLSNLGILKVNFWDLWRLWPVILILAGLEIILGRRSALGNIIVLIVTLLVIGGAVFMLIASPEVLGVSSSGEFREIEEPLEGVEQADLRLGFAAGELTVRQLTDSASLVRGELDLATERVPVWTIDRSGSAASMSLEYARGNWASGWNRGDDWELFLSPKVSLSLDTDIGAGDARIDLTGLDVRALDVAAGAGRSTIILPAEGDFKAHVAGGVGELIVEIPEEMAARIQVRRGLGGVDISDRFDAQGDSLYQTDDWATNDNRVELDIEVGVGLVTIREP